MRTKHNAREERRPFSRAGFTLVEVMLVVVILGILAGVAAVAVKGKAKRASIAASRMTIAAVATAIDGFEVDCGVYPGSLQELVSSTGNSSWQGPYLKSVPQDGFGNQLNYSKTDDGFTITSPGPDGQFGTGDDITN